MKFTYTSAVLAAHVLAVNALPSTVLQNRQGGRSCRFPTSEGLVSVDTGDNGPGWAMLDLCNAGNRCTYACPSGQLMAQWNPQGTSQTQGGGVLCNQDGTISKPFPGKLYCVTQATNVKALDRTNKGTAFCQALLPDSLPLSDSRNGAPLIPNSVGSTSLTLAVPDSTYWQGVAAFYFINKPGVSTQEACQFGSEDKPVGKWAPYVVAASKDSSGTTFVRLQWNGDYVSRSFGDPGFKVSIECSGGSGCKGLPCASTTPGQTTGGEMCIVQVPSNTTATVVVS